MRILGLTVLTIAVSGCAMPCGGSACAPAVAAAAAVQPVESMILVHKSWGAIVERITVEGDKLTWEKPDKPGFHGEKVDLAVKLLTMTSAQRTDLRRGLDAVQLATKAPEGCTNYIPDGPYGAVKWSAGGAETEVKFSASCLEGPDAEVANKAFAIEHMVDDWVADLPVAERRPAN